MERVREAIAAGQVYQVNLTRRFVLRVAGQPRAAAAAASRRRRFPTYLARLRIDGGELACASMELLLRRRGRRLESRPIKGTRPRGVTPAADRQLAAELDADPKERAELAMIVDLVRNDLGRIAETASVRVLDPGSVRTWSDVHHRVARVTARARTGEPWWRLLAAMAPAGSVTGCPKRAAMQLIAALEPVARGPFCGALGVVAGNGDLELALPIRTAWRVGREVEFGRRVRHCVGLGSRPGGGRVPAQGAIVAGAGGVTAREGPRAAAPAGAFTTAGCDRGRPLLWPRHRARLAATLAVLDPERSVRLPSAQTVAARLAASGLRGPARARVAARPDERGTGWRVSLEMAACEHCGPAAAPVRLLVRRWPAAPPTAGHKLLARDAWDRAFAAARERGADDALLVDGADRVLETAVANVLVVRGSRLVTPPAPGRCLPGVMRSWVLRRARSLGLNATELDLTLAELMVADEVWVCNAVIGLRRVERVDDRSWRRWPAYDSLPGASVPAPGWPIGR